jgi:hypothetical protein
MKLVFIDETGDIKFPKYLGISCVLIDASHYRIIKEELQRALVENGWKKDIEFKGSCIFSITKGDIDVDIEKRIEITERILRLNAKKNSKIKFGYICKEVSENHKQDYLEMMPRLVGRMLPGALKGMGKDVLSVHYDQREDVKPREVYDALVGVVKAKGYVFLENVCSSNSCYHTAGILYADLFGYLTARVDTVQRDTELFENISQDEWKTNGKLRKYTSSKKMLELIKNMKIIRMV